jgi:hypothetical protein
MIKHIAPIVNKTKFLSIVTGAGRQWIGDGSALYPCIGLPVMRDENIITILGLDPSKITIQHPKNLKINFGAEDEGYLDPDDMALVERGPSIFLDGELCRTYYSICGAIVAKERYFKPIEADKTQAEDPAYYLRIDGNFCYIVA